MGIVQKDALRISILSYLGLVLGYLNKGVFFIWFLSTEQIGLINLVVAVGLLFAKLSNLGTINAIWKFFPFFKNPDKHNHGFLRYILSIIFIGIVLITVISLFFKSDILSFYIEKSADFVEYYYWIIPIGIAQVLFFVFEAYLKSIYKNFVPVFINDILYRFLVLVSLVLLGLKIVTFEDFLKIYFTLYILPFVAILLYTHRLGELNLAEKHVFIKKSLRRQILNYSGFNYLNTAGAILVMSIDTLMIGSMIGLQATGVYTTIIYLTNALSIPYMSITRISMPIVAESWKDRTMGKLSILYKQISSVSLFIGITLFMFVWVNRIELFDLLPKDFSPGIYVFLFLMIGKLFDFFGGINGHIFLSSKKYKYDVIFTLVLLVNVATLNYFLIPLYGIAGAAISTSVALVVYNLARMIYVYFAFGLHPLERSQLILLALFLLNVMLFETVFDFQFHALIGAGLKGILFCVTFILPVYIFNIEPNSVDYIKKILAKIGVKRTV